MPRAGNASWPPAAAGDSEGTRRAPGRSAAPAAARAGDRSGAAGNGPSRSSAPQPERGRPGPAPGPRPRTVQPRPHRRVRAAPDGRRASAHAGGPTCSTRSRERKVAWILLQQRHRRVLADGVPDPRLRSGRRCQGLRERRYDSDLGRVLSDMFGVSPRSGPIVGPLAECLRRRARGRPPGRPPRPASAAGGQATAAPADLAERRGAGRRRRIGPLWRGSPGRRHGQRAPGDAAQSGGGLPGGARSGDGVGRRALGRRAVGRCAQSLARTWAATSRTRDRGRRAAAADELTGTDLIERELGGRIIEETGGA